MMTANLDLNLETEEEDEIYQEELNKRRVSRNTGSASAKLVLRAGFSCYKLRRWLDTQILTTPSIKKEFEEVEGVVLKICSRYRFFVGVGQMFDFKDVRKRIEEIIN